MRKKILTAVLLVFLLAPMNFSSAVGAAATVNQITLVGYFNQQTFDNLVLDFSIVPSAADTLNALTVQNDGSAKNMTEIEKVKLWLDNGNGKFDGFAVDSELAVGSYNSDNFTWEFSPLGQSISSAGVRFFVSVETRKSGTVNRTFKFALSLYSDANNNKSFDVGDMGVYLSSKEPLPATKLVNNSYAMYKALLTDVWAPVSVITNLTNGETIYGTSFKINGKSKDQGGGVPGGIEVCVDAVCASAKNTGENYSTWEYDWLDISEGAHSVYVKSNDLNSNAGQSAKISVNVKTKKVDPAGVFSATNSNVGFNKTSAKADGVEYIKATVVLKDTNNSAMANKKILVKAIVENGEMTIDFGNTNASGELVFKWRSAEEGSLKIKFITSDGSLIKDASVINFPEVDNFIDYAAGAWIKTGSSKAVYFLDKSNVRHCYPTQAIWESYFGADFSAVKKISDAEMAEYALGANVPFKFGTLMKIPSINKVYYVSKNGVLSWIPTADIAATLFGSTWAKKVKDLPESFWTDYKVGINIE
ncbi:hypothetical protein HZB94_03590 [Candidatus Falkowbacteria bacterium]|nr:hypothetical protein [Candidatus Falkowbacteria bacterium]